MIDSSGKQLGVVATNKAKEMAQNAGLDLVEIGGSGNPPVCKIMSLSKHIFELNKKASQAKKNQKHTQVKEIKLRPNTDEGDFKVKIRKIMEFITAGDKAKIVVRFKGREIMYQDLGMQVMDRICSSLKESITIEQPAIMEGKQIVMLLGPKR